MALVLPGLAVAGGPGSFHLGVIMLTARCLVGSIALLLATAFGTAAETVQYPVDVAVDQKGRMFIADQEASCIYIVEVGASGATALARARSGDRTPLFRVRGLALDKNQNLIAAAPGSYGVYRIGPDGKPSDLAPGKLSMPMDVAADAGGNLFIADLDLGGIYRIGADGAFGRLAQVQAPRAVAIDKDNSVAVLAGGRLARISAQGNVTMLTPAGAFEFPNGVAVLPSGEYLVTDGYARTVWRVSRDGKAVPFAKGDPLRLPLGICLTPKGEILVADPQAKAVFRISANGEVTTAFKTQ